jgi:hypothetical protein
MVMAVGAVAAACSLNAAGIDAESVATTTAGVGGAPTTTSNGMGGVGGPTGTGGIGGAGGGDGGSGGVGGIPGTGGSGGTGGIPGTGGAGGGAGGAGGGAGGAGGGIVCTDAVYTLGEASPVAVNDGENTTAPNNTAAQGCSGHGQSSGERIYAVTPDANGTATVSVVGDFTTVVYVRTDCDNPASEIMCSQASSVMYDFPVISATTYYIFVDGNSGEEGTFTLNVTLAPGA